MMIMEMGILKEPRFAAIFLWMFCFRVIMSDSCSSDDEYSDIGGGKSSSGNTQLFQYDPVEIGHVRHIEVEPGRVISMKTLAIDPPLFEINNFLTPEECDYIQRLALQEGLERSKIAAYTGKAIGGPEATIGPNSIGATFVDPSWLKTVNDCDVDGDSALDATEAIGCLPELRSQNVTAAMLDLMMDDIELDLDSDARLNPIELWRIAGHRPEVTEDIRAWLASWRTGEGGRLVKGWHGRTRVSDQTWLSSAPDDRLPLRKIEDRVVMLTRLPPEIVYTSEELQVVRYRSRGHYHAHYDSGDIASDLECRHTAIALNLSTGQTFSESGSRFCRFATILYYLNDVDEGGETAFPFADLPEESQQSRAKLEYDYTDLTNHCYDSSLIVKAELGKAILWYNHELDPVTGGLGPKRGHSLHGGCEVKRGTKWIANNWISVDDVQARQLRYIRSMESILLRRAISLGDSTECNHVEHKPQVDIRHVQSKSNEGNAGGD